MTKKFYAYAASLFAVIATVLVLNTGLPSSATSGRDCDNNAIIRCGATNINELQKDYTSGNDGTQKDIGAIYTHYGITKTDLEGTTSKPVSGKVMKNGDVYVGTKKVATNAMSVGRQQLGSASDNKAVTIGNTKLYERAPSVSFGSNSELPAIVFMKDNTFHKAVIASCGNPVTATPTPEPKPEPKPEPAATCKAITAQKISRNEYAFKGEATVENDATVKSYNFVLTDSNDKSVANTVTTSNLTATSNKITLEDGTYNVVLTVVTSVGERTSNECKTSVTVEAEPAPEPEPTPAPEPQPDVTIDKKVDAVEKKVVDINKEFTYQITVKNTGKTDLTYLELTDTPDAGITLVKASDSTITDDNTWNYTITSLKAGEEETFTITAKVTEYTEGDLVNTVCMSHKDISEKCDDATVTVTAPKDVRVCNPETQEIITVKESEADNYKPVDDAACQPQVKSDTTAQEPQEKAPETIASTGPAEVAGGVIGLSSLTAMGYYFQASRRRVFDAFLNK